MTYHTPSDVILDWRRAKAICQLTLLTLLLMAILAVLGARIAALLNP